MLVLAVLAAALVLVVVAVVASGRGGSMAPAPVDSVHAPLPDHRPVTPADVEGLRFDLALRGYRMAEVDDTLDRLGAEIAWRDARIADLEVRLDGPATRGRGTTGDPQAAEAAEATWAADHAHRAAQLAPGAPVGEHEA